MTVVIFRISITVLIIIKELAFKIAAQQAIKRMIYTGGYSTYSQTVEWWEQNKDDPKLIERNRSRVRFDDRCHHG